MTDMSELTDMLLDVIAGPIIELEDLLLEEEPLDGVSTDDVQEVLLLVYDAHNSLKEALDLLSGTV